MILKICSLRIDPVSGALAVEAIGGRDPGGERREPRDPRVAPRGPALLEDHDELRRRGLELAQELGAEAPDDRPVLVVEERSEERRVGKEGRFRGGWYQYKKSRDKVVRGRRPKGASKS